MSSEASVLPRRSIWAAVFGAALIGEALTRDDAVGGTPIVACLVNAAEPAQLRAGLPAARPSLEPHPEEPERHAYGSARKRALPPHYLVSR